jgi:hypothetical protein
MMHRVLDNFLVAWACSEPLVLSSDSLHLALNPHSGPWTATIALKSDSEWLHWISLIPHLFLVTLALCLHLLGPSCLFCACSYSEKVNRFLTA